MQLDWSPPYRTWLRERVVDLNVYKRITSSQSEEGLPSREAKEINHGKAYDTVRLLWAWCEHQRLGARQPLYLRVRSPPLPLITCPWQLMDDIVVECKHPSFPPTISSLFDVAGNGTDYL
jgi:hypothetical protein